MTAPVCWAQIVTTSAHPAPAWAWTWPSGTTVTLCDPCAEQWTAAVARQPQHAPAATVRIAA